MTCRTAKSRPGTCGENRPYEGRVSPQAVVDRALGAPVVRTVHIADVPRHRPPRSAGGGGRWPWRRRVVGRVAPFAVLAAVTCPAGQILASAMLPSASVRAPALRRLDSWLIVAPAWAGLVGLYLQRAA